MSLTPIVVPILATPFGVVPLPGAAAQNAVLADLFTARAHGSTPRPPAACYHSADDLFDAPEPVLRLLAAEMGHGVIAVVEAVNAPPGDALQALTLEARAWFTVIDQDGGVAARNYPLTAWCAIYCVAAPAASATRQDSGILRLYESRFGGSFQDATQLTMQLPYRLGHYGWQPVPGQMAVFPGCITHEIAPLRASAGKLILVTARVRFVGPGQTEMARW